jgi:cytochrome c553
LQVNPTKDKKMTETTRMAQTANVQDAISKINALRKLSRETGCITTRTQNKILQLLTDDEMTAVAQILSAQSEVRRG